MPACDLTKLGVCISGAYGGLMMGVAGCTSLVIPQVVGLCYAGASIVYVAALITCDDQYGCPS